MLMRIIRALLATWRRRRQLNATMRMRVCRCVGGGVRYPGGMVVYCGDCGGVRSPVV